MKRIILIGALSALTITAQAADQPKSEVKIDPTPGRYPLIATARLTSPGDVITTLGDGGVICGPFKIDAGREKPVFELNAGSCIGGTYPNWIFPKEERK